MKNIQKSEKSGETFKIRKSEKLSKSGNFPGNPEGLATLVPNLSGVMIVLLNFRP
jgi:hypothetical protein